MAKFARQEKMMNRFKTYAFWLALSSAIVILVQSLGKLFGFEIESSVIENVIMSICGVLVVLGIVTKNPENNEKEEVNQNDEQIENEGYSQIVNNKDESNEIQENNRAQFNIQKRDME